MRTWMMVAGAAALLVGSGAFAKDRAGYRAIAAGSLGEAEAALDAERAIFPGRPELMLNLAAVYMRTGRAEQARALYGAVLERRAVAMEMPDGAIRSSHALARAGLTQAGTAIAAR